MRPTHIGLVRGRFITQDMITRSLMLGKLDFFRTASEWDLTITTDAALLAQSGFYTSTLQQLQVDWDYLATECSKEQVLGPLDPSVLSQVHISRFEVIPKGKTG